MRCSTVVTVAYLPVSGLAGWLGLRFVLLHLGHFAVGDGDAGGHTEGLRPVGVDGTVAGHDVGIAVDAGDLYGVGRLAVSFGLPLPQQPHDLVAVGAVPRTWFHPAQADLWIEDGFERIEMTGGPRTETFLDHIGAGVHTAPLSRRFAAATRLRA